MFTLFSVEGIGSRGQRIFWSDKTNRRESAVRAQQVWEYVYGIPAWVTSEVLDTPF